MDLEPPYPLEALDPCPEGTDDLTCPAKIAEKDWGDRILLWGRTHHDRLARVCNWVVDLGLAVPAGTCGPK